MAPLQFDESELVGANLCEYVATSGVGRQSASERNPAFSRDLLAHSPKQFGDVNGMPLLKNDVTCEFDHASVVRWLQTQKLT